MRPEQLQDALSDIGEDLYDEENLKPKKTKHTRIKWTALIAALLCLSILCTVIFRPETDIITKRNSDKQNIIPTDDKTLPTLIDPDPDNVYLYNGALAMAIYPKSPANPNVEDENGRPMNDTSEEWYTFYNEMDSEFRELGIDLNGFYSKTCRALFKDSYNSNLIYSPVNLYMAMAMLAEITGGESRAQLLDLTECTTIEELRQNAKAIWKACYKNDKVSSLILANSLWLDDSYDYNQETLNNLAEYYYASSFEGESGSEEFNEELRHWLSEQTNGILDDKIKDVCILPEAILTLASTIYFYAKWDTEFNEELTKEKVFHSPAGDITCDFMHSSNDDSYYWADSFSAVRKSLSESGSMYFILPDEGYSPETILASEEFYDFTSKGDLWENREYLNINLSVPKFDISSKTELKSAMIELGVTDIFELSSSNFENLTEANGFTATIEHTVRVNIDEEGCEAAAFTLIMAAGSAMPPDDEIDFVLDRPFIFVITSDAGIPLYTGIVNNP